MKKEFNKSDLIHFIGIGGIGMSGIAELMHDLGYLVQGSDIKKNSNISRLLNKKIKIFIGHNKNNINGVNLLVSSSAIQSNNIEIISAINKRLPVVSRAEMLGELMRFKRGIAVAGSHGKTTTTSILGNILQQAKLDPTIVNGGIINSLSTNSRMGKGKWMVAEADESDGSFLLLPNEINIITNIDNEHIDYYKSIKSLFKSFKKFSSNIPFYGSSIICLEDEYSRKLANQITTRNIITYGINKKDADLNITSIDYNNNKSYFNLILSLKVSKRKKRNFRFSLNQLGKHNVLNASAAILASLKIGIKIKHIEKALLHFKGVERRFTYIGKVNNTVVYDDYAHHPKEIKASIEIARILCKGKIILIFQPHRYSRTNLLFNDFVKILKNIDVVILGNIYSAGEKKIGNLNNKLFKILKKTSKKTILKIDKQSELRKIIKPYFDKNNLIIFMGAGSITKWAKDFILKSE